ncbi:hypothetical protein FF1_036815 [Malus domestica]
MEGAKSAMIHSGSFSGRLIPKRGQVKVAIVGVLLHSFSSIFSASSHRKGKKFELFSCNKMIFRPANSEEGSGEDGDRGGINQLCGFHLQSSWFINTQASSQITRIVTGTNIETESLGQEVLRI